MDSNTAPCQSDRVNPLHESFSSHFLRVVTGRLTLCLSSSLPPPPTAPDPLASIPDPPGDCSPLSSRGSEVCLGLGSVLVALLPAPDHLLCRRAIFSPAPHPAPILLPFSGEDSRYWLGFGVRRQLERGDLWTAGLEGGVKTGRLRSSTVGARGQAGGVVAMAPW